MRFEKPEITVLNLEILDVITTSNQTSQPGTDWPPLEWLD